MANVCRELFDLKQEGYKRIFDLNRLVRMAFEKKIKNTYIDEKYLEEYMAKVFPYIHDVEREMYMIVSSGKFTDENYKKMEKLENILDKCNIRGLSAIQYLISYKVKMENFKGELGTMSLTDAEKERVKEMIEALERLVEGL